eukprot:363948_1
MSDTSQEEKAKLLKEVVNRYLKSKTEVTYGECFTFLHKQHKDEEKIDLSEHRLHNEIKVGFHNNTANKKKKNRFYINHQREYHVDRYITDGCRHKLIKCKEGRKLVQDGKVQTIKISPRNPNKIQTKVIPTGLSDHAYTVAVKCGRNIIKKNKIFISTRDIIKTHCSGCGVNRKCRHTAAVLFSLCDFSSIQKPLKHRGLDCYQVCDTQLCLLIVKTLNYIYKTLNYIHKTLNYICTGNRTYISYGRC